MSPSQIHYQARPGRTSQEACGQPRRSSQFSLQCANETSRNGHHETAPCSTRATNRQQVNGDRSFQYTGLSNSQQNPNYDIQQLPSYQQIPQNAQGHARVWTSQNLELESVLWNPILNRPPYTTEQPTQQHVSSPPKGYGSIGSSSPYVPPPPYPAQNLSDRFYDSYAAPNDYGSPALAPSNLQAHDRRRPPRNSQELLDNLEYQNPRDGPWDAVGAIRRDGVVCEEWEEYNNQYNEYGEPNGHYVYSTHNAPSNT